jgi:hypothetical protein
MHGTGRVKKTETKACEKLEKWQRERGTTDQLRACRIAAICMEQPALDVKRIQYNGVQDGLLAKERK